MGEWPAIARRLVCVKEKKCIKELFTGGEIQKCTGFSLSESEEKPVGDIGNNGNQSEGAQARREIECATIQPTFHRVGGRIARLILIWMANMYPIVIPIDEL